MSADVEGDELFGCVFEDEAKEPEPEPDVLTTLTHNRINDKGVVKVISRSSHHSLWGHMLWNAARETADILDRMADADPTTFKSLTVLEIGAGMGLPGIVCKLAGAKRVVITDYADEVLLDAIRRNISENFGDDANKPLVLPLTWGTHSHMKAALEANGGERYDIVILSDVVFNHVCHDQLATTVLECLKPTGVGICTFTHHRPHKQKEDMNFILSVLPRHQLVPTEIHTKRYEAMFENDPGDVEIRSTVHYYQVHHVQKNGEPLPDCAVDGIDNVDVIVQGTDIETCLVAGALARAGKKVLHLDANDFYGGNSGTLPLRHFRRRALHTDGWEDTVCHSDFYGPLVGDRGYNLDLSPAVLLADGEVVNFLIDTGVGKYLEFKNVDRLIGYDNDKKSFHVVPLTKQDLFRDSHLTLIEKRMLMKVLTVLAPQLAQDESSAAVAAKPVTDIDDATTTLKDFLSNNVKLTQRLRDWLVHILLNLDSLDAEATTTIGEAKKRLALVMTSTGKYGPTPFITYQYGAAEFPQACSRVCAVYEGMYVLRQRVTTIEKKENDHDDDIRLTATLSCGQKVHAKHIVGMAAAHNENKTSRVLLLCTAPLLSWTQLEAENPHDKAVDSNDQSIRDEYQCPTTIITIPPCSSSLPYVTRVLQVNHNTQATPKGITALHFISRAPLEELKTFVDGFVSTHFKLSSKTSVVYRSCWSMPFFDGNELPLPVQGGDITTLCEPHDAMHLHDTDVFLGPAKEKYEKIMKKLITTTSSKETEEEEVVVPPFYEKLPDPYNNNSDKDNNDDG
eukprot:PhM_4_TR13976/c0_g1_i2/m.36114